jgi:hypothetical protein
MEMSLVCCVDRNEWWVPGKLVEAREQLRGYWKVPASSTPLENVLSALAACFHPVAQQLDPAAQKPSPQHVLRNVILQLFSFWLGIHFRSTYMLDVEPPKRPTYLNRHNDRLIMHLRMISLAVCRLCGIKDNSTMHFSAYDLSRSETYPTASMACIRRRARRGTCCSWT